MYIAYLYVTSGSNNQNIFIKYIIYIYIHLSRRLYSFKIYINKLGAFCYVIEI